MSNKKKTPQPATPSPLPETFTLTQDGETLIFEGREQSCMTDYEHSKEPNNETETFFDWCKNSYPFTTPQPEEEAGVSATPGEAGKSVWNWHENTPPTPGNEREGFTPGEWKVAMNGGQVWAGNEKTVCVLHQSISSKERMANARLIASAPTLYKENQQQAKDIELLREALKKQSELMEKHRSILTGDKTYFQPPYTEKNVHIVELDSQLRDLAKALKQTEPKQ